MSIALRKSIASVLAASSQPQDLGQIAYGLIAARGDFSKIGAVPLRSIYSCLEEAIRDKGERCPFLKTHPGVYMLRRNAKPDHLLEASKTISTGPKFHEGPFGIISCFGVSWHRNKIKWTPAPEILGYQFQASAPINFGQQIGFYALHWKNGETGYVGSAIEKPIGTCLYEHTQTYLSALWDRFSFFGILPVADNGAFDRLPGNFDAADTLASLATILVGLVSPHGNKGHLDWFSPLGFSQWESPDDGLEN